MHLISIVVLMVSLFLCGGANATGVQVLSPEGTVKPYLGPEIFHSFSAEVKEEGKYLVGRVWTNYPGYNSADIEYNIADLRILAGSHTLAVKLSGPRSIMVWKN